MINPRKPTDLNESTIGGARLLIWPGAPDWVGEAVDNGAERPPRLVANSTLREIRCQVARAALERISTSSVSATRGATAG